MYDFDKTLSTTDMQNYDFIPAIGMTPAEFWGATTEVTEKTDCTELFRLFAVCLLVFSEYYRPKTRLAVPLVTSIIFSGVSPLRAAISSTTAEIMSEVHLVPLKGTGLR